MVDRLEGFPTSIPINIIHLVFRDSLVIKEIQVSVESDPPIMDILPSFMNGEKQEWVNAPKHVLEESNKILLPVLLQIHLLLSLTITVMETTNLEV